MLYTGDFPRESAMINRIVFNEHYESSFDFEDTGNNRATADFYYVRVTQTNGQMAWSSPIWVG